MSVPIEKRDKALLLLNTALSKKKVTIKFVQRLAGTLNFINRARASNFRTEINESPYHLIA